MDKNQFAHVSESIANAILEREQVHPVFLHRNSDNSFTATFDEVPAPSVRQNLEDSDDMIVVLDVETVEARQPDKPYNPSNIRFAFVAQPSEIG